MVRKVANLAVFLAAPAVARGSSADGDNDGLACESLP